MSKIRLGVNIDHVATVRNARGENFPNLLEISVILKKLNVDLITVHLREDRRHINDKDLEDLKNIDVLPLNLEMAATNEMKKICLNLRPFACCIVPEKREELTTEGWTLIEDQAAKVTKERCDELLTLYVNGGQNPNRLRAVAVQDV